MRHGSYSLVIPLNMELLFRRKLKGNTVCKTIELLRDLFARYGLPELVVSDNGSQFTSEEFSVFMQMNGVKHVRSAPYHPSTNGLAERIVQSLKHSLKASQSSGLSLSQRVSNFLFMYRSTVHSTTGVTPASLFLKHELRTLQERSNLQD